MRCTIEETQKANKRMKRCSPSLAVWEMQIKNMITPIRSMKIKSENSKYCIR